MTPHEPDMQPTTSGYGTVFIEFVTNGEEVTPDVIEQSRLGRPDPSPHLELALRIEEELKHQADRERASTPAE